MTREWRTAALEDEIEEVRQGLPLPFTPEEEKIWRDQREQRKLSERRKADELRKKILQRGDKALRREGLAELDRLVQSNDPEELVLGLTTLRRLADFIVDKKSYREHILTALENEEPEARLAAVNCLYLVCSREENLDIFLSLTGDRSPMIREHAVALLWNFTGNERNERVATVLRKLLTDEHKSVRREALTELAAGYDYREELEDLVIELSRDPETREAAHICLSEMKLIDAKVAQRLAEMFDSARPYGYGVGWMEGSFTEDAKPIVRQFCLDLVWDSLFRWDKKRALKCLQAVGDLWVLRELETFERSPGAEEVGDELAKTIESLRQQLEEQER